MSKQQSSTPSVRNVEIDAEAAGQRLDNFLMNQLRGVPRSRIYRIVRSGEVRVNSGRAKPSQRLQCGDRVRIPPVRVAEKQAGQVGGRILAKVPEWIVYEDDTIIAVNKPSGIAVHGGSGLSYGLIEALRASRPEAPFLELVHRLDRDTSGCVLLAKRRSALRALHEALREGQVRKVYLALVAGRWPKRRIKVDKALRRDVVSAGERMVRASASGRESETRFAVLQYFDDCSLVEARPITGRTHQIRVHTQVSGHPIAGDPKYGEREFNRLMKARGLKRLFLHASTLRFQSTEGREVEVSAPLDQDLQDLLARLADKESDAVHL